MKPKPNNKERNSMSVTKAILLALFYTISSIAAMIGMIGITVALVKLIYYIITTEPMIFMGILITVAFLVFVAKLAYEIYNHANAQNLIDDATNELTTNQPDNSQTK